MRRVVTDPSYILFLRGGRPIVADWIVFYVPLHFRTVSVSPLLSPLPLFVYRAEASPQTCTCLYVPLRFRTVSASHPLSPPPLRVCIEQGRRLKLAHAGVDRIPDEREVHRSRLPAQAPLQNSQRRVRHVRPQNVEAVAHTFVVQEPRRGIVVVCVFDVRTAEVVTIFGRFHLLVAHLMAHALESRPGVYRRFPSRALLHGRPLRVPDFGGYTLWRSPPTLVVLRLIVLTLPPRFCFSLAIVYSHTIPDRT